MQDNFALQDPVLDWIVKFVKLVIKTEKGNLYTRNRKLWIFLETN